ncbi:twin-arginine translocase subunit TatC [Vermiculatibacterium agrestimuris]|uniref:twin-arginine translocase subunit TatC n=1 Tax=Vermiculatibacterium agrestimuris TaxID=2941519 RepID=UPI00203B4602|nr:twin-arginine translocase subunit TatC [Vermiculatibacterium agrestimuris]
MAEKTKSKARQNNEKRMKLTGHLKELRNRLIVCLLILFIGTIVGLGFAPRVVEHLLGLGEVYGYQYVYLAPQELLMQYMSVALIFGLVCAMPVIMYEVWAFARPGLTKRENLAFVFSLIFGSIFFCVGVYFAYRIMLPTMLLFLSTLENRAEVAAAISVQNYISFLLTIFIIFGVVFELPVISVVLNALKLLKVEWMKKARRFVIVISFVVAAFITPPDVISQIMVGIPIIFLYQLSIILCLIMEKLRRRRSGRKQAEEQRDENGEERPEEEGAEP